MIMATRLLNLLSGLIVLATGGYVGLQFASLIADPLRWTIVGVAVSYFALQVVKFVIAECTRPAPCSSMRVARKLELDNGWQ
jgi:hypothetical protein